MPMNDTLIAPRKRPRQARSRALVDAVLDAAAHILAQHGRESLTTNAVAVRAGVSIGSLYQYFPNRDAVIAAVAERHGHRVYHLIADLDLNDSTDLTTIMGRIARGLFAAHMIDPALHGALVGDLVQGHGHGHHHHHHGGHHHHCDNERHVGTKAAIVAQICGLIGPARLEIRRADIALAAVVVAEIVHAIAHIAIINSDPRSSPACFEQEAVRAAVSYLTYAD